MPLNLFLFFPCKCYYELPRIFTVVSSVLYTNEGDIMDSLASFQFIHPVTKSLVIVVNSRLVEY